MKKVVIEKTGSYERLQIKEFPNPKPKKGEILVQAKACGVNFADCCVRMGVYKSAKEFVGLPITPGFEISGIILEVGEGVTRFKAGQKVIVITLFGGYTTHLIVPEDNVFPLPESLNFAEGAGIPTVFLTAYQAMFNLANVKKHQSVLIHSAAGGVGSALMQLAKLMECKVFAVVGNSHKVNYVKSLGADIVTDKSTQNLWKEAEKFAPNGFDIIFDANGAETLKQSYQHLARGGKLVIYGFHTMFTKGKGKPNWIKLIWDYLRTPRFNPLVMTSDNRSVLALNLSYMTHQFDLFSEGMHTILNWLQEGKLKPILTTRYPFEEVAKAQRDLETGQTIGKLVLINE